MGENKNNTELGVIGQNYEDRRTHKAGKLISRDETHKALYLESADGKSFVVSYSTFRSNYRKSTIADEFETAEDNLTEVTPIKPVKAEVPKKELNTVDAPKEVKRERKTAVSKAMLAGASDVMRDAVNVLGNRLSVVNIPAHNALAMKLDCRRLFELYAVSRKGMFRICMHQSLFDNVDWKIEFGGETRVVHHEDWKLKEELWVTPDNLSSILACVVSALAGIVATSTKEEREED